MVLQRKGLNGKTNKRKKGYIEEGVKSLEAKKSSTSTDNGSADPGQAPRK
jgi:hypothetical protein